MPQLFHFPKFNRAFAVKSLQALLFIALTSVAFHSCKNQTDGDLVSESREEIDSLVNYIEVVNAKIEAIGIEALSLRYEKEQNENVQVKANLDDSNVVVKLSQEYFDNVNKVSKYTEVFLRDGVMYASRDLHSYQKKKDDRATLEYLNFYDQKGQITKSFSRHCKATDDISTVLYESEPKAQAVDLAAMWRTINQEEEFATNFRGFIVSDLHYLVVGTENGYTTTLRVEYYDRLIQMLLGDKERYMNQPLSVKFEIETLPSGLTYQIYQGGTWK